jgi:anti-anti-sigma regulatory factor
VSKGLCDGRYEAASDHAARDLVSGFDHAGENGVSILVQRTCGASGMPNPVFEQPVVVAERAVSFIGSSLCGAYRSPRAQQRCGALHRVSTAAARTFVTVCSSSRGRAVSNDDSFTNLQGHCTSPIIGFDRRVANVRWRDSKPSNRNCAMLLPADATARNIVAVHALLCDAERDSTTVDCRRLERCDAAGLQLLVAFRDTLAADGRCLVLTNVPVDLHWYFVLVGLDGFITDAAPAAPSTR